MSRALIGRRAFMDALRDTLLQALADGERAIWCSDPDFSEWPLNESQVVEALSVWAEPHRRLWMLAQHYDEVVRRQPRFARWHRDWSNCVDGRVPSELDPASHPTVLVAGRNSVELLDRAHWNGRASDLPADAQRLRATLDAISQRSEPGFAATTLGL